MARNSVYLRASVYNLEKGKYQQTTGSSRSHQTNNNCTEKLSPLNFSFCFFTFEICVASKKPNWTERVKDC